MPYQTEGKSNSVKCKDCIHWEPTKDNKGICYRYAPRPVVLSANNSAFVTVWAETESDRRCGDGTVA